jgi:protein tyrosine phosphatase (PTP) superfamily phosphohydrolase (DUF442 family)
LGFSRLLTYCWAEDRTNRSAEGAQTQRGSHTKDNVMKNEAVIGGITVGGQPSAEELKSGRFAHVVNIRGADEAGNVTGEVLAGSDVAYTSVPWTIDTVTIDDIDRMRDAIAQSEGPVLIH